MLLGPIWTGMSPFESEYVWISLYDKISPEFKRQNHGDAWRRSQGEGLITGAAKEIYAPHVALEHVFILILGEIHAPLTYIPPTHMSPSSFLVIIILIFSHKLIIPHVLVIQFRPKVVQFPGKSIRSTEIMPLLQAETRQDPSYQHQNSFWTCRMILILNRETAETSWFWYWWWIGKPKKNAHLWWVKIQTRVNGRMQIAARRTVTSIWFELNSVVLIWIVSVVVELSWLDLGISWAVMSQTS